VGVTVLAVDGGNSKTELVVATAEGEPLAYVRGGGSNSHAIGADGCAAVIAELVERARVETPVDHGAFFLCGADVPDDIAELSAAVEGRGWAREVIVENDTFALLRTGSRGGDAVAVVCGAGINCVGRGADGRVVRYPGLGWETGDWGGSEALGRKVLFFAVRAEDGRSEPTALVDVVRAHFGAKKATDVGEAIHYRRLRDVRLGELAPATLETAAAGDAIAQRLVGELTDEIVLLVTKALRDLATEEADVVLGGGMLRGGFLVDEVTNRLPPGSRPVVVREPPALGAALAALDAAGARPDAEARLRAAFAGGLRPQEAA